MKKMIHAKEEYAASNPRTTMKTPQLTPSEYADPTEPFRCPFCLSENVTLEADVGFLGDVLEQPTSCDDCHEEWVTLFTLSGFARP
jgi:hypothetical protein